MPAKDKDTGECVVEHGELWLGIVDDGEHFELGEVVQPNSGVNIGEHAKEQEHKEGVVREDKEGAEQQQNSD